MSLGSGRKLKISKLEAARRQLRTAMELWFADGDPVSIHALAFAEYEIIHFVSKKRAPGRRDLVFDSRIVKDEYRAEWNRIIRQEANFFKHADRDPDGEIELSLGSPEFCMMFAILGLECCKEDLNDIELTFQLWLWINRPDLLTPEGKELFESNIPVDALQSARKLSKQQFLEYCLEVRLARRSRHRRRDGFTLNF
jgi:hypothetical protein